MNRIAVVTSIDRRSAVARATLRAAEALAERADVTIFAEPTLQPLPCPLPLRGIDDGLIRQHDHAVTVLGDSPFHIHTYWAARRIPSVVILHDVLLAHLLASALPLGELHREFVRWYGAEAAALAMRGAGSQHPSWDGPAALDAPLFDPAIEFATGVMVHSQFAARHVAPRTIVPVHVAPLAYEAPWTSREAQRPDPTARTDGPMLLTLGQANPNKSHELIIEGLAALDDPTVRFVVAGGISSERESQLRGLARALDVEERVEITGHVSDAEAGELLERATLCLNLRWPALEGGSASLVEQMAAGRCVVVFDEGCYADPPDDAVVKLPVATSPQALAATLRGLLDDSARRDQLGARAREHARTHGFEHYAASLLRLLDEVESSEPQARLVRRVAADMRAWGVAPGSQLAGRWAAATTAMTDVVQPPGSGRAGTPT